MRCRVDVQVENVKVREVVWDIAGEFGVAGREMLRTVVEQLQAHSLAPFI